MFPWVLSQGHVTTSNNRFRFKLKMITQFTFGLFIGLILGGNFREDTERSRKFTKYYNRSSETDDKELNHIHTDLMLVGVLTAKEFINTRLEAINGTWAKTISGKVIFFSGEDSSSSNYAQNTMVTLPGVTDTYPPQKKAFLMLKYMHDFYLDQFEWFVRADDDVYIKGEKLAKFLTSVNSSEIYYIGHSGIGRKEEKGKLGLSDSKTYCMGGPGVIMSRATLAKVAPNISYCLKNLYTSHEDTELGRCINEFANVSCTKAKEMFHLFFQNYNGLQGSVVPSNIGDQIENAITLHPFKDHKYMYGMKQYQHQTEIRRLRAKMIDLRDSVNEMNEQIQNHSVYDRSQMRDEVLHWYFLTQNLYFGPNEPKMPKRQFRTYESGPFKKRLQLLRKWISNNLSKGQSVATFKRFDYGYQTLNPQFGAITIANGQLEFPGSSSQNRQYKLMHKFGKLECNGKDYTEIHKDNQKVNFVIPLYGRSEPFNRFIKTFENVALKTNENVSLTVVFFRDGKNEAQYKEIDTMIHQLSTLYPHHDLHLIPLQGSFQRAIAFQNAVSLFADDALLFLVDIDCSIDQNLLHRIRYNTHQGKQAFFPIMFSQYNPKIVSLFNTTSQGNNHHRFSSNNGYWRLSSFGQVALYKSDFDAVGGFNTDIKGWGKEDTDFATRILSKRLHIFRSPDPGLVHIHHEIKCDPHLPRDQHDMCVATIRGTYGSDQALSEIVYNMTLKYAVEKPSSS